MPTHVSASGGPVVADDQLAHAPGATRPTGLPTEPPSLAYFSWVRPVWRATDDQLLASAGLDATLYVKFARTGVHTRRGDEAQPPAAAEFLGSLSFPPPQACAPSPTRSRSTSSSSCGPTTPAPATWRTSRRVVDWAKLPTSVVLSLTLSLRRIWTRSRSAT